MFVLDVVRRLTFSFFIAEIEVPSWILSVSNIESTKADASWEEFPQNDIQVHIHQMYLKISEANKNISLLLPVSEWERSRHIQNLYPDRNYLLQVVAFTGPGIEHDIYSSVSVSMKTNEGGMLLLKMDSFFIYVNGNLKRRSNVKMHIEVTNQSYKNNVIIISDAFPIFLCSRKH